MVIAFNLNTTMKQLILNKSWANKKDEGFWRVHGLSLFLPAGDNLTPILGAVKK